MSATQKIQKKIVNLGVAWEGLFGYVQGVQVKDTIYLSGQLSHDKEGTLIAPAPLNQEGRPAGYEQMETQIRQTYRNAVARAISLAFRGWRFLRNWWKSPSGQWSRKKQKAQSEDWAFA